MNLIPIATHIYRNCIIGLNPNPAALRWQSYCNGRFVSADTLAGIKQLIKETLNAD